MNEMSPIDSLKGIGEKTRAVFEPGRAFRI